MGDRAERRGGGRAPADGGLTRVLDRNVEALLARRRAEERAAGWPARLSGGVVRAAGSLPFAAVHVLAVAAWAVVNLGLVPGIPAFDESFATLAAIASVEALFLSTFILITQNRMAAAADRRADLDLQISLLAEHELTRLIRLTSALATRAGVPEAHDRDLDDLGRDIRPDAVLDHIERAEGAREAGEPPGATSPPKSVTH